MLVPNWLDEVLESLNEERVTPCHYLSLQEKQPSDKIADPETRMNKGSSNSVTPVTPENDSFEKKSADIEETRREQRHNKLLAVLAANPDTKRAYSVDDEADPDNVIVSMVIRGVASFEITISKDRYDPFIFLGLIERGGVQ